MNDVVLFNPVFE